MELAPSDRFDLELRGVTDIKVNIPPCMTLTSLSVCFINIPIDTLSATSVYVCSYHLYKSLLGKLFNAHYSIVLLSIVYNTNLQLG